jgi:stage V sporulation protein SpoVS
MRTVNSEQLMPGSTALNPQAEADRIEAAADQAIAACGGNARDAVKALIITNEFLENEVSELMRAVSTPTCGDVQDLDGDKNGFIRCIINHVNAEAAVSDISAPRRMSNEQ